MHVTSLEHLEEYIVFEAAGEDNMFPHDNLFVVQLSMEKKELELLSIGSLFKSLRRHSLTLQDQQEGKPRIGPFVFPLMIKLVPSL